MRPTYTRPGGIILMHDRNVRTIKAVSRMLPVWRDMGYRLESLPACRLRWLAGSHVT
jgi:peptidoglycan/xylan/chitin deacetylase (PgdA/CDA1 family)